MELLDPGKCCCSLGAPAARPAASCHTRVGKVQLPGRFSELDVLVLAWSCRSVWDLKTEAKALPVLGFASIFFPDALTTRTHTELPFPSMGLLGRRYHCSGASEFTGTFLMLPGAVFIMTLGEKGERT